MKRIFAILAGLAITVSAMADEGMWLLPLLKQLNGKDLKAAGCRLSPDEIYSINKTSLKDAIVHFGGGCTGEMISAQELSAQRFLLILFDVFVAFSHDEIESDFS